jgi:hypothetical protein
MDGLYNFTVHEPIFREYLQELDDEELSREARNHAFSARLPLAALGRLTCSRQIWSKRNSVAERRCREFYSELFEALVGFGGVTALVRTQTSRSDHIPKFPLGSAEDRGGKEANRDR